MMTMTKRRRYGIFHGIYIYITIYIAYWTMIINASHSFNFFVEHTQKTNIRSYTWKQGTPEQHGISLVLWKGKMASRRRRNCYSFRPSNRMWRWCSSGRPTSRTGGLLSGILITLLILYLISFLGWGWVLPQYSFVILYFIPYFCYNSIDGIFHGGTGIYTIQ